MGQIEIEVTLSEGTEKKLIASPAVAREGIVVWIFSGGLEGKNLKVRGKNSPITFHKPAQSNQISGIPFQAGGTEDKFEYEIVEILNGQDQPPFQWECGRNGGCVKPMPPPGPPTTPNA